VIHHDEAYSRNTINIAGALVVAALVGATSWIAGTVIELKTIQARALAMEDDQARRISEIEHRVSDYDKCRTDR